MYSFSAQGFPPPEASGERARIACDVRGMAVTEKVRRSARLNMRLTPSEFTTIREAARREGVDVTTFMLAAALERASSTSQGDRHADAPAH